MALQWYRDLLLQPHRALVVAPETALPLLPQQLPEGYLQGLQDHFAQPERAALIGLPLGSMEEGYTNSVMGLRAGQSEAYRYDKHHLVPFGEFIPPLFRWFTDLMRIPLGDFNRGALVQPTFDWRGERFAPHICYEDLFGEELAALFVQPGRPAPTVLVNLSNIGWFGNTLAIDQHLAIARMRALEFERPMVRATNTGATAIIDHRGVVTHQLARHERGVLVGQVEGRDGAPTPYAHWAGRWRLWPLWALGGLVLMMAALRKRVPKGPRHTG
jgi:apolipoprotein N-acyltransferase